MPASGGCKTPTCRPPQRIPPAPGRQRAEPARLGCLGGKVLPNNLSTRLGHGAAPLGAHHQDLRALPALGLPPSPAHGCGGPGDSFGFALRQRGILFLAIKQSRPGTAEDKGRRGFLMESCRQSQRCRDSPAKLSSRLPPRSPPQRGPSPCPIPPAWDFRERVFLAPQDLPGATGTPGCMAPVNQLGSSGRGSSSEKVNGIDTYRFLTRL